MWCVCVCVCVYVGCANVVCQRINMARQLAFTLRIRHVFALHVCDSLPPYACECMPICVHVCVYVHFANYLAVSSALSVSINN